MKKTFLVIFFLFALFQLKAQNGIDPKKFSSAIDTIICFKCNLGKSKAVNKVTALIKEKNYLEIKKLMLSKNAAERFLAAITCQKASNKKIIFLTKDDEMEISKIFNSQDLIYAYSNDTYVQIKPIKFYVYGKEERIIWVQAQNWLDKIIN